MKESLHVIEEDNLRIQLNIFTTKKEQIPQLVKTLEGLYPNAIIIHCDSDNIPLQYFGNVE